MSKLPGIGYTSTGGNTGVTCPCICLHTCTCTCMCMHMYVLVEKRITSLLSYILFRLEKEQEKGGREREGGVGRVGEREREREGGVRRGERERKREREREEGTR